MAIHTLEGIYYILLIKNFLIVTYNYDNLVRLNNNIISTGSASFTTNYSYEVGAYLNSITDMI
ncbi:hypothetical protein CAAU_1564 [Caloramator australicus RC3]|uniref:Uncharacterized protein n=2 Tax=Clostridiaceae TaxID=31979 RepID=I7KUN8_9CLOT|nr:hypothetical protein CAAU_1564 [Caloramator australicus RC3]